MVLGLTAAPDQLLGVAAITELHYDEDFSIGFVDYSIIVFHYVGMIKFAQNVDLADNLLLLLFTHYTVVKLFPNKLFPIRNPPDLLNFSKGTWRH